MNTRKPGTENIEEPDDVDALLAESLKAQSEKDFTWKEPERKPRWFERAEMQNPPAATSPAPRAVARDTEPRFGQMVFGAICLILAFWCLMTVLFGFFIDPVIVALGICTLAGLAFVAAGLRPRRRRA